MTAFDLGSNTLRAVEIECSTKKFNASFEKIVRTADGLAQTGYISDAALERICNAIDASKLHVSFQEVKAVTTEALRRAHNAAEVLNAIETRCALRFEVISPEAEAIFTLNAVQHRLSLLGLKCTDIVLVDIGGGSTELTFVSNEIHSKSFPVGIVTLTQKSTPETFETVLNHTLEPVKAFIKMHMKNVAPWRFVATAGTPTTIAAFTLGMDYDNYNAEKINGFCLSRVMCEDALQRLLGVEDKERARYVGVGKEDLIITGVKLFMAFFPMLACQECLIIDDGLREGVALSMCKER